MFVAVHSLAQTISASLPTPIKKSESYLFYFHGAVVTELGNNAINQSVPEWGPYEFSNILDTLRRRGFNVISEIRKKGTPDSVYVQKLVQQVDSLSDAGVRPDHIIIVGASAGWSIVLRAASLLNNKKLHYVIMGGCWPDTYKEYTAISSRGRFLSIIEASDPHQTCMKIFEHKKTKRVEEITLHTGLSHGFIYKGYKEWVDPLVYWHNDSQ
jgi:hypothetical protein